MAPWDSRASKANKLLRIFAILVAGAILGINIWFLVKLAKVLGLFEITLVIYFLFFGIVMLFVEFGKDADKIMNLRTKIMNQIPSMKTWGGRAVPYLVFGALTLTFKAGSGNWSRCPTFWCLIYTVLGGCMIGLGVIYILIAHGLGNNKFAIN